MRQQLIKRKKKLKAISKLTAVAMILTSLTMPLQAEEGEMGCFGGITSGIKLETITALSQTKKKSTSSKYTLPYKENIYLSGKAETVEGTIEIRPGNAVDKEKGEGTKTEVYVVKAQSATGNAKITRNITLETQYTYDAKRRQVVEVTTAKKWSELVTAEGKNYQLQSDLSHFSKSILVDETPGVQYYRGDLQYEAVYKDLNAQEGEQFVTLSVSGPIYGYEQAYSKTETQKRTLEIDRGAGQGYIIEEIPSYTVYRDMLYDHNEPTAISMAGNYKEIIRSEGALSYQIIQGAEGLYESEQSGALNLSGNPTIEQLSIPTALNLGGHPAEAAIKKMYSLKIWEEAPSLFSPNRALTYQEYIKMLVKALHIPLPESNKTSSRFGKQKVEVSPFTNLSSQNPYYPYAKAAYEAGLIEGGRFDGNTPLTRERLYVLNVRAIGLQRLGRVTLDAYTPFIDDRQISTWAKAPLYAASKLGLITDTNGYIFPQKKVTYAEGAVLLEQFIDYLRYDLQKDYSDLLLM